MLFILLRELRMRTSRWVSGPILAVAGMALARPAGATGRPEDMVRAYIASHSVAGHSVPSFARQTGLACSACHYQFLTLTPFGRKFKLNGYTLTSQQPITEPDSARGGKLSLLPYAMLSAMVTAGVTHTKDAAPNSQNDVGALPQELSGFLAGRITPRIGLFSQFTYAGADGAFGIDNVDIRFASAGTLGKTELSYGLTLNNNPTVQDLWNTTPAWGFPFIGSEAAPSPAASPLIDGGLGQRVLGAGAYGLIGNLVYAEFSVYRSALQGVTAPDNTTGAIKGVAPYWRLALQKDMTHQSVMVGTFGMRTRLLPGDLTGPNDVYSDIGVDAQLESKLGPGNVVVRGRWMHERQTLNATYADGGASNRQNTLNALNLNASFYPKQWVGVSGGYFDTRGTADDALHGGKPTTNGFMSELDFNPWENTRIGLQYIVYSKFDGASHGSGNNTLFAFLWMAF